jgi:hypothetical protein
VHGADERPVLGELLQPAAQVLPHRPRVLLQLLLLHRVEDGEADDAGDRAAAGRGEEVALVAVFRVRLPAPAIDGAAPLTAASSG